VADKNWLKELVGVMGGDENIMIATPTILKSDKNTLDALGTSYSIFGAPFPRFRNQSINDIQVEPELIFGGAGGASLYKCELFIKIGCLMKIFLRITKKTILTLGRSLEDTKLLPLLNLLYTMQ
jgi:GT2 family glycosyltransferase